jgi:ubiquinone biosynthesis protein COQ9
MPQSLKDPTLSLLLDAILPHVAFDGWGEAAFVAALTDSGIARETAMGGWPRGAVDLAVAYHQRGDDRMVAALADTDLDTMRIRDKIVHAIELRLQASEDKEIVRRGSSLFALPHLAPLGAQLIWGTSDAIWTALGDPSQDSNWYSKRATLSAVYSSVVLFWLGDESADGQATRDFIDRRIENVMQFEKLKSRVNDSPVLKPLVAPLNALLGQLRAPVKRNDMPGYWDTNEQDKT